MNCKTILITAGPTREYIDPVRFVSNESSGKMGYLLAKEAKKHRAKVILISGPTNLKPPKNIKVINVVSAKQMLGQVLGHIEKCDIFISCAAVSDYKPSKYFQSKIKKTKKPINLKLIPNRDILYEVSKFQIPNFKFPVTVGFALETQNLINNAQKKMRKKKLDMVIANTVNSINSDKTTGAIITKNNIEEFKNISKKSLAKKIIKKIL